MNEFDKSKVKEELKRFPFDEISISNTPIIIHEGYSHPQGRCYVYKENSGSILTDLDNLYVSLKIYFNNQGCNGEPNYVDPYKPITMNDDVLWLPISSNILSEAKTSIALAQFLFSKFINMIDENS